MLLRLLAVAVVVAAVGVFVAWAMLDNDETEVADPGSPATAGRTAPAHDHGGDCGQATPLGALPPALPAWCNTPLASGPGTFVRADNSWLDEFEHGLSNAEMGQGYLVFDRQGAAVRDSIHFRHNNHWMVDVRAGAEDFGGATMRPDAAFRFQDGKLVIEAEVAAGIVEYQGSAWAEIGVTTAPAPTGNIVDALYAYGLLAGSIRSVAGCRRAGHPFAPSTLPRGRGFGRSRTSSTKRPPSSAAARSKSWPKRGARAPAPIPTWSAGTRSGSSSRRTRSCSTSAV